MTRQTSFNNLFDTLYAMTTEILDGKTLDTQYIIDTVNAVEAPYHETVKQMVLDNPTAQNVTLVCSCLSVDYSLYNDETSRKENN